MVAKKMSQWHKDHYIPKIIERDGDLCFLCDGEFEKPDSRLMSILRKDKPNPPVIHHLNNDESDNRLENWVRGHELCNQRMKFHPPTEWVAKCLRKLRDNEKSAIPTSHANNDKETHYETDTNSIFAKIVTDTLHKKLVPNEDDSKPKPYSIDQSDFLDLVTGKGYKIVGHASQKTMERILKMFCTSEFRFIREKNKQKTWTIRLRTDEEMREDED